jgi:hypothetical protein
MGCRTRAGGPLLAHLVYDKRIVKLVDVQQCGALLRRRLALAA